MGAAPWFENHQAVYRSDGGRYVIDRSKLAPDEERKLFGLYTKPRMNRRWVAYDWDDQSFSCHSSRSRALYETGMILD